MDVRDFARGSFARVRELLHASVEGLSEDQLTYRPDPEANSVGWLGWHITRGLDRRTARMSGGEQVWVQDRWYERFNLPANPNDFGIGHTSEQVSAVRPKDPSLITGYYDAVYERMLQFIDGLSPDDLNRPLDDIGSHPATTVGQELLAATVGNLVHVGQAAYVRGLVEKRRWYHR